MEGMKNMGNMGKIRDISVRYNVSARALRYYEDMGLIESTRSDEYAYRLYDEAAVKRLEQILILRRLNISIKSVHMIYADDEIRKGLGYHQMNFYAPIKLKNDC